MYDPQLRRFLSPDNFIQDPYDTRSYDRFGYVWQNPLMNSDPSGELLETAFIALQLVKFISAGLNLYNLGNNIFGGFNNQFTYGPTGGPQVMNTNSNFNQFLNGSNKIDGVYLSSTNSIQDSIVRQDQNTFLDGPPKNIELYPKHFQQEKPDWSKISDQERIYEILKGLREANINGDHFIDLREIFRNFPEFQISVGTENLFETLSLNGKSIDIYMDVSHIGDMRISVDPGRYSQINNPGNRYGIWDQMEYVFFRNSNAFSSGQGRAMTIQVQNNSFNILMNYLKN